MACLGLTLDGACSRVEGRAVALETRQAFPGASAHWFDSREAANCSARQIASKMRYGSVYGGLPVFANLSPALKQVHKSDFAGGRAGSWDDSEIPHLPLRGTPVYIAQIHSAPSGYTPGVERDSLYKDVWRRFWPDFKASYAARFEQRLGPLSERKIHEVERLLACGRFSSGFVRHECDACGTVLVVPFSCKSRLCLSCYRKKLFSWSLNLSKILEPSFGHSHITFTR